MSVTFLVIDRDDTEQELKKILEDHGFVVQEIEFEGEVE